MVKNKSFSSAKEKVLLKRLKAGDIRAVRSWYKEFFPIFLRMTLKKVSNKKDAEEIVQETFINALKQLHLFQGKSKLKTWMTSILFHEIADFYRKKYAKKALKVIPLFEEILQKPLLDSSDLNDRVEEVMNEMRADYRKLLLMKYFDKQKVKEIAKRMKKTVKAIESDLFRARQEFKEIYLAKGYLN